MAQEYSPQQRSALEKELEDRVLNKLVTFKDTRGQEVIGFVYMISLWPDPKPPHELEVSIQVNQRMYKMSLDYFNEQIKKL